LDPEPVEFVELNFDFHPRWMRDRLDEAGLTVERTRAVSTLRVPLLKRLIPAPLLAAADGALQWTGAFCTCAPSIFVRARTAFDSESSSAQRSPAVIDLDPSALFRCPACEGGSLRCEENSLHCLSCGARWAIDDCIYDFKDAVG